MGMEIGLTGRNADSGELTKRNYRFSKTEIHEITIFTLRQWINGK